MTKHPDQNPEDEAQESEDEQNPFAEYDDEIQKGLESDPRFESGVSPSERGSDLDFIQMSGLTAPLPVDPEPRIPQKAPADPDLDPNKPISFFEEGVADVDASMAPSVDEEVGGEEIYSTETDNRAAMQHLRDMIAELTRDEPAPPAGSEPEPSVAAIAEPAQPAEKPVDREEPPETDSPAPIEVEPVAPVEAEAPLHRFQPFELTPRAEPRDEPSPESEVSEEPLPEVEPVEARASEPETSPEPEPELPKYEPPAARAREERPVARVYTPPPLEPPKGLKPEPPASPEELGERVRIPTVAEAEEAMYLRHSVPKTRRRRSGHRKHARRRMFRVAAGFVVLLALAAGGAEVYGWYERSVSNPTALYNEAVTLANRGAYREASSRFATFAQRNPASELHADAQFAAAFTLQQVQPAAKDEQTQVYAQAIALFQQFLTDNPTHAKAPRARTLMGRLYYEMGQYQEAIELLRDPELRLLDPIAAVPAVRTLARSYAKLGQDDSARSYYMQAVGLQDNHTPDVDYMELGSLYRSMAERAADPAVRQEYETLAAAQWTHAVQAPGIDPATKKELRAKIDVMREQGVATDDATDLADPDALTTEPLAAEPLPAEEAGVPWEATAPALDDLVEAPVVTPETSLESDEVMEMEGASMAPEEIAEAPDTEGEMPTLPVEAPEMHTVYRVVAGDTLSGIADRHGVSVADLMAWNDLTQSVILVDQELVIHGAQPQESDPSTTEGENNEENRDSIQ